jgi:hypothetical protein
MDNPKIKALKGRDIMGPPLQGFDRFIPMIQGAALGWHGSHLCPAGDDSICENPRSSAVHIWNCRLSGHC